MPSLERKPTVAMNWVEVGSRVPSSLPPLLVLHGLFGASGNFKSWATQLGKEYETGRRIVLADLRNHGDSPHAASMRFGEMAEDVLALMDKLDLERAVLIGHSLGAKVAMVAALRQPERIERLLVLDMAPVSCAREPRASRPPHASAGCARR